MEVDFCWCCYCCSTWSGGIFFFLQLKYAVILNWNYYYKWEVYLFVALLVRTRQQLKTDKESDRIGRKKKSGLPRNQPAEQRKQTTSPDEYWIALELTAPLGTLPGVGRKPFAHRLSQTRDLGTVYSSPLRSK